MAKINCPKCFGNGLIPPKPFSVCPECNGVGTIGVDDSQSLATISAASLQPLEVTADAPESGSSDAEISEIESIT